MAVELGEAGGNEGREGHRAEGGLGLAKEGVTAKKMVSFFWTSQKWHYNCSRTLS